jgi:hypothetical protein
MSSFRVRRFALPVALTAAFIVAGGVFAAGPSFVPSFANRSHGPEATAPSGPSEGVEASAKDEAAEPSEAAGGSPSDKEIASLLADLQAAGITATSDQLKALAAKVGVGGAVRVLAFADASGKSPDDIVAMFESGKGWGEIAKELDLTIGPGIGGIVSSGHSQGSIHSQASAHPDHSANPGHGKNH